MSQGSFTKVAGGGPGDEKERHPKGLYVLFFTEMWERFSFYLMIGIFSLYLTDSQVGGMGWSETKAAGLFGSYIGLVYFTPFLGGLIADRLLGYRKTIILGGIAFIIGHITLAFEGEFTLYLALTFLIVGNGLFKPNISTMVGRLYPQGSPLRDGAYTIFYMGINIGAFACNFVAAIVRNKMHGVWGIAGWHWAFATAGVGMALGVITFMVFQKKHLAHVDITPEERAREPQQSLTPLWVECFTPAVILAALGWLLAPTLADLGVALGKPTTAFLFACIPVIAFYVRLWRKIEDTKERGRVGALLTIFGVVVVFWMIFHQNGTALNFWANNNTDRQPNALIEPVVDAAPDFAETATPKYFYNAGPSVPRPDLSMFTVLPEAEYAAAKEAKKTGLQDGIWVVSQEEFDKVYAGKEGGGAKTLPPGQQLKLVNPELFQSINAGFIILCAPLMVALWSFLRKRRKEPSMPAKISAGLFVTGLSALVMVGAVASAGVPEGKVSSLWLFGTYFVITIGELCLSPIGLSLVSKLAPRRIAAFMMGGWFLSTSVGNKLSGVMGETYSTWDHTFFFCFNAACAAVAAGVIFALLPWLRRQMA